MVGQGDIVYNSIDIELENGARCGGIHAAVILAACGQVRLLWKKGKM
jgi:hypothetical protein